ncbi:MAG: hypothetical protein U9R06_01405 [Patescibacteria group bacterium]|nr:hypothetical protein [Patescibacteria group bacterium]
MAISKHGKVVLIIFSAWLFGLALLMTLHNIVTLMSGREEKVFYFIFILLFFLLPLILLYSLAIILIAIIKQVINKKQSAKAALDNKINVGN